MRTIAAMILVAISGELSLGLFAMSDPPYSAKQLGQTLLTMTEEPYQEYWWKLGKFIHNFAQAESRFLWLVRDVIGVEDPIGGLLLSGMRLDGAKDIWNRVLDATDQIERKTRLERFLDHLSANATIRNNILHWGATHDGERRFISVEQISKACSTETQGV
jgi:hypothetical protein